MARTKAGAPSLPTKKTAAAQGALKRPVGRPRKNAAADPKASTKVSKPKNKISAKIPAKKPITASKTPSLVNAQPLSTVSLINPEQMLYESNVLHEPTAPVVTSVKTAKKTSLSRQTPHLPEEVPYQPPKVAPVADSVAPSSPAPHAAPARQAKAVSSISSERPNILRRALVAAMVLVLLAGGWYMVAHRSPNYAAENSKLIASINKLAVLPKDETPSVTTVVDETKINQDFLRNAKKGDKVLLYFQAGRAVVYRPSTGQIVNMGPLETPKPRVFIRRGSTIDNTGAVRNTISRTSDFLLASQDESPNKSYAKTVVVDVTGNRPDLAGKLAQMLHVNVVPLPAGEDRPDADLLVIVGSELQ